MKMPKVRNAWNRTDQDRNFEKNSMPSLTVPDQTMTVKQILDRYARGLSFNDAKVPIYDGEDDILEGINWQSMDLAEREQFKQDAYDELLELQKARLAAEASAARPKQQPPASKQSAPAGETVLNVNQDGSTSPIS